MKSEVRLEEDLLTELAYLRQRVAELEAREAEREQASRELSHRVAESAALQATLLDITAEPDLPTLLHAIVERAVRLLDGTAGGLYLCDPQRQEVRCVVSYNTPHDYTGVTLEYGEGAAGKVAATGKPLIIDDYRAWEGRDTIFEKDQPFTAIVSTPMIWQERVTGVIHVLHDVETRRFNQEDLDLLSAFANQASVAVENTRLLEKEREQRELAEALRQVGIALSTTLDFETILDRLLDQIARVVPYDAASVMVVKDGHSHVARSHGYEQFGAQVARDVASLSFDIATTANLRRMSETGRPMVIPDTEAYPDWVIVQALAHLLSWAGAPILVEGQVVAFFSLDKLERNFYQPAHAERLAAFAGQAAIAIHNARLFQESQRKTQELAALYDTAVVISGVLESDALLARLYEQVQQLMGPDGFGVFLYHADSNELEITLAMEQGQEVPGAVGMRLPLDEGGLTGWMLRTGQPLLVGDMHVDPLPVAPRHLTQPPARSWLGVPLVARERLMGAVSVQSSKPHAFSDADRRFLESIAAPIAIAFESAWLFAETRRQAEQLETLQQVSQDLVTLRDLDSLLHQITERAIQLLGGNAGGIYLYDPDHDILEWSVKIGEEVARPGIRLERGEGLAGRVWLTGEPLSIDNYHTWSGKSPQWSDLPAAALGVPIQRCDEFLGVLVILADKARRRFSPQDIALLSQFATHSAIAIENARLFSKAQQELAERMQAEVALREGEQRYRQLVQHAPAGIYEIDYNSGKLLSVNDVMCEYTGYSREEFLSMSLADLLTKEGQELFAERQRRARSGELVPEVAEYQIKGKADRVFWVMLNVKLEYDDQGVPTKATVVAHDITERRRLEEQYRQAQKMEAIGLLAGGIAHDFNNLLTAINGFTELMQFQLSPQDPLQETLERILSEGRRGAGLVSQLLAFSRKQIIEPKVLDLNAVVAAMDNMLWRIIGEHIEIRTDLASDLWPVKLDPTQIEQVIINLTVNARDAMPQGGQLIIQTSNLAWDDEDVSSYLDLKPADYVALTIRDTGMGMTEEVKGRLFQPFFTTKGVGKGTGLGLATVYGIVKQNGGDIQVYSEEGQGTTFRIYLPRSYEAAPTARHRSGWPQEAAVDGETILLVEDDASVREVARIVLEKQGYTVLEASSGPEALRVAASYGGYIHLLLTDVVMPTMDGRALAVQLVECYPNLKTLFMSGHTDDIIVRHGALEPGMLFLQKPFSALELNRKVRAALAS
jgi:PAS domain S-box-containing protein